VAGVVLSGECRRAVIHHHGIIVAHECLTRGGSDTDIGGDAGQNHGADRIGTQDGLEIGVMKSVVAVLGDNRIARLRADRTIIIAFPGALGTDRKPRVATRLLARRLFQPGIR
jgi:hypothetical protein